MPLVMETPRDIDLFFLQYSNYSTVYDVDNIKQILTQIELPLLFASRTFPSSLADALPLNTELALKKVLEGSLNQCFSLFFTNKGEMQPWVYDLFEDGQLQDLFNQFGKTAIKFELFYWWALKYCEVFNPPVDIPSDEACSATLNLLIQHELDCYRKISLTLIHLERLLHQTEDSYKLKKEALKIVEKFEEGLFTNHLFFQPKIKKLITDFSNVIKEPHQMAHIQVLQQELSHLTTQSTHTFWFDLLATICSFCMSFFLVGGLVMLFGATNIPLAMVAIGVGLTFLACGLLSFQQGRAITLGSLLENFSTEAKSLTCSL